jgi:hypothetical protein|tara:strand:+ start:125 stop:550 length:426 start_codon:yes stop_codon:yes gene_type:complete
MYEKKIDYWNDRITEIDWENNTKLVSSRGSGIKFQHPIEDEDRQWDFFNNGEDVKRYILYRAYGEKDELLYVGKSKTIMSRITSHLAKSDWKLRVVKLLFEDFKDEKTLDDAEIKAIKKEKPMYNKTHNNKEIQPVMLSCF